MQCAVRRCPLKLTDKRHSLKRKENWRKLLLLGIHTGDKLAKPLFFVAYSRLCCHCHNLAEGGCPFHNMECVPLGWSGSGSVIRDHSDHSRSNEPMNPCPEWIHWFIWSTMIRVILDHWSWSGHLKGMHPSFFALSLLFGLCHLLEFTLVGPLLFEHTVCILYCKLV